MELNDSPCPEKFNKTSQGRLYLYMTLENKSFSAVVGVEQGREEGRAGSS